MLTPNGTMPVLPRAVAGMTDVRITRFEGTGSVVSVVPPNRDRYLLQFWRLVSLAFGTAFPSPWADTPEAFVFTLSPMILTLQEHGPIVQMEWFSPNPPGTGFAVVEVFLIGSSNGNGRSLSWLTKTSKHFLMDSLLPLTQLPARQFSVQTQTGLQLRLGLSRRDSSCSLAAKQLRGMPLDFPVTSL